MAEEDDNMDIDCDEECNIGYYGEERRPLNTNSISPNITKQESKTSESTKTHSSSGGGWRSMHA